MGRASTGTPPRRVSGFRTFTSACRSSRGNCRSSPVRAWARGCLLASPCNPSLMTKNEPTIVIADDHPVFREGLRQIIEREKAGRIVGEAPDGATALRLVLEHRPRIALLDVVMPGKNGLAVAREIQRQRLNVAVVFLTMFKEEDMFNEAMDLGAKGYV